jgi:CelD/BcsL family acetyltransferase involved in cellulose biosynthesis
MTEIGASLSLTQTIVAPSFDDRSIDPHEWDDFVVGLEGDVYVSYDWCRIWWRHYGCGRTLRIFIFREAGQLVGIAPMFIERSALGPFGLRVGKRVGADHALTLFALPLASHVAERAYTEILSTLIKTDRCDAVWIGVCPGNDPSLPGLRAAANRLHPVAALARDAEVASHIVFDLPASFDAYLGTLDRRQRQNYRRQMKQFREQYRVGSDVIRAPPDRALQLFDEFRAIHRRQWLTENKLGHFGDWPGADSFNRELVETLSRSGRFRMIRLKSDDEIVSNQYAFVYGRRCFWRLPARSTRGEYDRFGLGVLGLVQLIEVMIDEGVHSIEAGLGHYDYKIRYGGKEMAARSCVVVANRWYSQLRYRVHLLIYRAIDVFYYKIWFRRVAVYLPFFQRPLWKAWIRSRL